MTHSIERSNTYILRSNIRSSIEIRTANKVDDSFAPTKAIQYDFKFGNVIATLVYINVHTSKQLTTHI